MKKLFNFDVLVVYTEKLAVSASNTSATPFPYYSDNESYNIVYGYFMEICQRFHINAAFTTSADIIGAGSCSSFWIYKQKKWSKVDSPCFSNLIFDKFSPISKKIKERRELLFSTEEVKPFNDPGLFDLFFDKQKTYEKLFSYAIPTVFLKDNTLLSVNNACKTLAKLRRQHVGLSDFSQEIVLKDRFGAGGRRVYKFKKEETKDMLAAICKKSRVSYIIQPFTKFDRGFRYNGHFASTDIRLIYLKGKIIQSYIRVAKSGDFRCNEHQGGVLTYLSLKEIPVKVVEKANLIAKVLDNSCSLFTLDFIVSNGGNIYLLEGNTGPGLDWDMSSKRNGIEAKKLIRLIVKELAVRARNQVEDITILDSAFSIPLLGYPAIT